jgi:glyoxylase-like metal-dependent hydrolase (beta-lactamase superfamily II)
MRRDKVRWAARQSANIDSFTIGASPVRAFCTMPRDPSIHTIDTAYQRSHFDAAYLIVENGRAAFVDCGTSLAVPAMLAALAAAGVAVADVEWLILTHIHLDHAGGAGQLLRQLPNARLYVHPRGAPHMIDPTRLIAGAAAVYGEAEMARSYGQIVPVPAERVVLAEDGGKLSLAGRELLCLDTPGHARHHLCVWDARSRSWFSGDTFGISYREMDNARGEAFVIPTSSPVQFEPEAMRSSIERMLAYQPAMVAIARGCDGRADRHRCLQAALTELYQERARAHGCRLDDATVAQVLAMDIELNAQGLECWLDRERR